MAGQRHTFGMPETTHTHTHTISLSHTHTFGMPETYTFGMPDTTVGVPENPSFLPLFLKRISIDIVLKGKGGGRAGGECIQSKSSQRGRGSHTDAHSTHAQHTHTERHTNKHTHTARSSRARANKCSANET